ncbi:MAG: CpsD/CapB family tyrosine-protein kinase [Sulfuricaulis sp.]
MSIKTASYNLRDSKHTSPEDTDHAARPRSEIAPVEHILEPDERLIMAHDPYDPRCEKIRALRTELLLRREPNDRADIVALLSPCAGEGRSLLAADLAIAFAQMGRPTLLVDADMRHPQQHIFFGADNHQGLAQAIESGVKPPLQTVQGLPQMAVLTAGAVPHNPLELLSSARFASMVEDWSNNFEFVVIDTAPVMHFSDGLAVASLVGRVLALSRAQHTPYKEMQDMLRRLAATRSQILGAVISHF